MAQWIWVYPDDIAAAQDQGNTGHVNDTASDVEDDYKNDIWKKVAMSVVAELLDSTAEKRRKCQNSK